MKIQSIINGSVTLALEPENPMEEEILKVLIKQSNELYEVRTPITVLGKTIRGSVLICSKETLLKATKDLSETSTPNLEEHGV